MSINFSTLKGLTIPVMKRRVNLTNMLPSMSSLSFKLNSLTGPSCEMSTAHTKYSEAVPCITGYSGDSEEWIISTPKFQLDPTHIYYACVETYQEEKLGSFDYYWPSSSPSVFSSAPMGTASTWKKFGKVIGRTSFTAGEYAVRLDFNNGGTAGKAWYDGMMLIDLTADCGAGNEPTVEWCDANIPYFIGTIVADVELSSPVQAAVKQIADASGRVLWSAVKPVTITITGVGDYAYIVVDGVTYRSAATLSVPVGTVVECHAKFTSKDLDCEIYLNGTYVAYSSYSHTVTSDVVINMDYVSQYSSGEYEYAGIVKIIEIPEGYALVQITGKAESTSYDKASVKIDGVTYTSSGYGSIDGTYQHVGYPTLAVPIGTIIECSITDSHDYTDGKITVNGTTVASKTATYNYEVIGDTSIYLYSNYYNSGYYNHSCGSITIIETYAINLNPVANGTLTAPGTGNVGSTVTLTPTPDEGYIYAGATVTYTLNGAEQTITLDANTKTFTMPAADVIITPVWVALISFIMNGETYRAEPGMTWSAWFASSYNTTGETEGTIKDANGNEVSMDSVIVGGTAYEVGFSNGFIINVSGCGKNSRGCTLSVLVVNTQTGQIVYSPTSDNDATVVVPAGTINANISVSGDKYEDTRASIYVNGVEVEHDKLRDGDSINWTHTIAANTNIRCDYEDAGYEYPCPRIYITET